MDKDQELKIALLRDNPRAIVHLRRRRALQSVGLVLGAGISRDLGLPTWEALIEAIEKHPEVDGAAIVNQAKNPAAKVQILYQRFKEKYFANLGKGVNVNCMDQQLALTAWLKLVHGCLYGKAPPFAESIEKHPYIKSLIPIITTSPLTINYNFDNAIEFALDRCRSEEERKRNRGSQTITDATAQFRRDIPVIYHPNGYLARVFSEYTSETIVFSDESFADQLIHSMSGQFASLLNHFSRNTCLFVGLSLEDATLRHLLRQSARMAPGHYHYLICFTPDKSALSPDQMRAIRDSNFDVYNVITLFLGNDEIRALAELVSMHDDNFQLLAEKHEVSVKFTYYLLGSVGAGKSTSLAHLRTLQTYDEWFNEKPEVLIREPGTLSDDEKVEADNWINDQFQKKNFAIRREKEGIHVADRCPLDPICFNPPPARATRAAALSKLLKDIEPGQLIMLDAETDEIVKRLRRRHKGWKAEAVDDLKEAMRTIYGPLKECRVVQTGGKPIGSVVQEISRIIHLDSYEVSDIKGALEKLAAGGGA